MACSKVAYGRCSRCGTVGKSHFARVALAVRNWGDAQAVRALREEYHKSQTKKGYPTPAQRKAAIRRLF